MRFPKIFTKGGTTKMSAPYYLHAIDGRVRIKVPVIKGSAANAARITCALEALVGVQNAKANPTTGNVLVLFDQSVLGQQQIIAKLIEMDCFGPATAWHSSPQSPLAGRIAESVVQSAVQVALERVILALV
jgi:copper chaperone CopZ